MAKIFGAMTNDDNEYGFLQTIGQEVVYVEAQKNVAMHNEDMALATSAFISGTTEIYKTKYKLPSGGRMQKRGHQSRPGVSKAYGSWEVAYPLEDFMDGFAGNDIDIAYTSAAQLDLHFTSSFNANRNTLRYEMLLKIFKNTTTAFTDIDHGALTIQPLANGTAGELYPPIEGSEDEATENMYLFTSYTAANISDTNNPIPEMVKKLTDHFGSETGGKNIVIFINNAQASAFQSLTNFDDVEENFVLNGDNVDTPTGLPISVPGITLGRCDGAWIQQWNWIPANYAIALDLEIEPPLKQRVDPAVTMLPSGLSMVSNSITFPFMEMYWRNRYGIGTANRLNGVVMDMVTTSSYTIPTDYQ